MTNEQTAYYFFHQNNSRGVTKSYPTRGIADAVVVKASSVDEACSRAEEIGLYFDGVDEGRDCECCGDRWSRHPQEFETLEELDDFVQHFKSVWIGKYEVYVHPADGYFYEHE